MLEKLLATKKAPNQNEIEAILALQKEPTMVALTVIKLEDEVTAALKKYFQENAKVKNGQYVYQIKNKEEKEMLEKSAYVKIHDYIYQVNGKDVLEKVLKDRVKEVLYHMNKTEEELQEIQKVSAKPTTKKESTKPKLKKEEQEKKKPIKKTVENKKIVKKSEQQPEEKKLLKTFAKKGGTFFNNKKGKSNVFSEFVEVMKKGLEKREE